MLSQRVCPKCGSIRGPVAPCPLTPRELDILRGLWKGMTYKQIALVLGIADQTARTHASNMYHKLDVFTGAQAVIKAYQEGWL